MFLAHEKNLSDDSYILLDQFNKKKILAKNVETILVSNVCPHQGSLISSSSGKGNRTCPYHNWTFDVSGRPLTSGRTLNCKNTDVLRQDPVFRWNSLLFSKEVAFSTSVDFSNMNLVENRIDMVHASPENIMDLFLDVDHIPSVHPGVYDKIGIDSTMSVDWEFYKHGSIQTVYDSNKKLCAYWIAVYPFTMIEWQPGALFITVAGSIAPNMSAVSVFKYMDLMYDDHMWDLNEDVWETAWAQDKHQASLLTSFNTNNLETSKIHYREFLNRNSPDQG